MRALRLLLALVLISGVPVVVRAIMRAQQSEPRYLVMISIDGLEPSTYTRPGPSKVPTLRRLAREGAYAEGVVGVEPTVTYPSHTTMITGVPPALHGIYNNRIFDPEETSNGSWYWIKDASVSAYPLTIHCKPATLASSSVPIVGSATFTTVASRNAMPDPSTVASSTQRALGVPHVTDWSLEIGAGTIPPDRTIVLAGRPQINEALGLRRLPTSTVDEALTLEE